jgi:predicted nucleotidyltransferase component of viral defense system
MSNISQIIKTLVKNTGVQQDIIQKDYALSYLISAITTTPGLGERLVLKGGTTLRKLYFPGYRFSEDLDYTAAPSGAVPDLDPHMQNATNHLENLLNQYGPFRAVIEPLQLREVHPGGQSAYIVRVQFPNQRQPLCRLKVEITIDEPLMCPVETHRVIHEFPEPFEVKATSYSLEEIAAEKMRALLESRIKLQQKGWGASRVCRDYYDLWRLLKLPEVTNSDLISLIEKKCVVRKVSFTLPKDFLALELIDTARREWEQQLLPFVPNAPPADELLPQVKALIHSIWD